MAAAASHPRTLSDQQQQSLQAVLQKFTQSWAADQLPLWHQRLPAAGHPLHRPALVGLIGIDLQKQWQHGRRPSVESYLQQYPELGSVEQAPPELMRAEWQARRQAGETLNPAEFARRFPGSWPQLQPELEVAACAAGSTGTDEPVTRAFERSPMASAPAPETRAAAADEESGTRAFAGSPPAAAIPEQLGRYRIQRPIGQGGMGTVYLAHDTELDRPVALKVLRVDVAADPAALERFTRAARAAAALTHPGLCPIYDVGQFQGIHYLAMPYIDGKPLAALLQANSPWPPRQAAALVRKLAEALQVAHAKNVLHRNLTPANILIGPDGEPAITDFGLARREGDDRMTKTGQVLGTPGYLAPEHLSGVPSAQGTGGDIYALGAILYELLTGEPPFGRTMQQVLLQIMTREPLPPSKHRPDVEPALDTICLKALARKPEDRYRTMTELVAVLQAYLKNYSRSTHEPAQAITPSKHTAFPEASLEEPPKADLPGLNGSQSSRGQSVSVRKPILLWWSWVVLSGTVVTVIAVGLIALWIFARSRSSGAASRPTETIAIASSVRAPSTPIAVTRNTVPKVEHVPAYWRNCIRVSTSSAA